MSLSPIVFFAYNRLTYHTIKSLESLKKNKLSKKSNIIIFIDGPKNIYDKEKVNAVKEIIKKSADLNQKKYFFVKRIMVYLKIL